MRARWRLSARLSRSTANSSASGRHASHRDRAQLRGHRHVGAKGHADSEDESQLGRPPATGTAAVAGLPQLDRGRGQDAVRDQRPDSCRGLVRTGPQRELPTVPVRGVGRASVTSAVHAHCTHNARGPAEPVLPWRSPQHTSRLGLLVGREAAHAGEDLRAGSRPADRHIPDVHAEVGSSAHHAGQPIGPQRRQLGDDLLGGHRAAPPGRRRRRTISMVAETSSSRRVRFRVDAVRAAPGAPRRIIHNDVSEHHVRADRRGTARADDQRFTTSRTRVHRLPRKRWPPTESRDTATTPTRNVPLPTSQHVYKSQSAPMS